MTNQPPIKVECENCGYGRLWPGRYAEELEATKADLLAALEALVADDAAHERGYSTGESWVNARAAIRRARGED